MRQIFSIIFGLDSHEGQQLRRARLENNPTEGLERIASMVANQIWTEQSLTGMRMTWNLTFQGFTIAGYALVATSSASTPGRAALQTLIAIVSIIVAFATLRGMTASARQRSYLRRVWETNELDRYFPQPFSDKSGSNLGRAQGLWICWALMGMWAFLLVCAPFMSPDKEESASVLVDLKNIPALTISNPLQPRIEGEVTPSPQPTGVTASPEQ